MTLKNTHQHVRQYIQPKRYIITGPPGSGKTSIIEGLQKKYPCVEESSRRFIIEELSRGGNRLPWKDVEAFDKAILQDRILYYNKTTAPISFFDRGIPDSLAYLKLAGANINPEFFEASKKFRYETKVFFLPSWKEIYKTNEARKETFAEALLIEKALKEVYKEQGYELIIIPKLPVSKRISLIEKIIRLN